MRRLTGVVIVSIGSPSGGDETDGATCRSSVVISRQELEKETKDQRYLPAALRRLSDYAATVYPFDDSLTR